MSISYWLDESPNTKVSKDIVIIGGGIAGVSSAFWLQKEDPSLEIALVEKGELGFGATGRNAGFITCGSVEHFNRLVGKHGEEEANAIWKFSEENLSLLKEHVIQDSPEEILFENKGSFSLASTTDELNELKNSAALMEKFGINVEIVDQAGVESRIKASGFVGGIKYVDDASVHPIKLLHRMRKKISQAKGNVEFFENNEVYKIEDTGGNKIVKTNKCQIETPLVVYATNGFSPLLNDYFADKIFPTRGQILATEPVERFMEAPCYANFVLDYFRQLPTGELIIGGFRQIQKDAEIGYSDQTSDVIQNALEEFIQKHIPPLANKKITHRWSGIMGFSVDGQPMVGALPTDPQQFFIGGFTAHGLGLAFNSAKKLTDSLFERPIPAFLSAKRLH